MFSKEENYLRKQIVKDYSNMKFIVDSTRLETDFCELKDPVAFLDSIKSCEISIEKTRYKQKEFDRY